MNRFIAGCVAFDVCCGGLAAQERSAFAAGPAQSELAPSKVPDNTAPVTIPLWPGKPPKFLDDAGNLARTDPRFVTDSAVVPTVRALLSGLVIGASRKSDLRALFTRIFAQTQRLTCTHRTPDLCYIRVLAVEVMHPEVMHTSDTPAESPK